jgi:hypothetical protein
MLVDITSNAFVSAQRLSERTVLFLILGRECLLGVATIYGLDGLRNEFRGGEGEVFRTLRDGH